MVDDERDVVLTLVALLRDEGYEVKGACSAAEALVALAELDPLLIAISGRYTKGSDRILGKISGFNHQLAKPFDPKALIALLKHAKVGHA